MRRSPVGVSTIRKIYGIRKSNGSKPSHWIRGAGGLARKALQVRQSSQDVNIIFFSTVILIFSPGSGESEGC